MKNALARYFTMNKDSLNAEVKTCKKLLEDFFMNISCLHLNTRPKGEDITWQSKLHLSARSEYREFFLKGYNSNRTIYEEAMRRFVRSGKVFNNLHGYKFRIEEDYSFVNNTRYFKAKAA